jgi:hypothetical protein
MFWKEELTNFMFWIVWHVPGAVLYLRFQVLAVVNMSMFVFWVVTPRGLVGKYQRFKETYCLHLQGWRRRQYVSSNRRYVPMNYDLEDFHRECSIHYQIYFRCPSNRRTCIFKEVVLRKYIFYFIRLIARK